MGLSWPLPSELDDDSVELLLFPSPTMASRLDRSMPDWAAMDVDLRRPDVTRALMWEEYRARAPDGFGYAGFCEHFDAWKGRVRPTMRQTHVGGEKVFVDFAGDTIDVIDPATAEARAMKLFVAAMGASNCIVNRIMRPRLTCACCERFVQVPLPSRPIERGRPGPGQLAHVLVSKYADHLPLYRQSQIQGPRRPFHQKRRFAPVAPAHRRRCDRPHPRSRLREREWARRPDRCQTRPR